MAAQTFREKKINVIFMFTHVDNRERAKASDCLRVALHFLNTKILGVIVKCEIPPHFALTHCISKSTVVCNACTDYQVY